MQAKKHTADQESKAYDPDIKSKRSGRKIARYFQEDLSSQEKAAWTCFSRETNYLKTTHNFGYIMKMKYQPCDFITNKY